MVSERTTKQIIEERLPAVHKASNMKEINDYDNQVWVLKEDVIRYFKNRCYCKSVQYDVCNNCDILMDLFPSPPSSEFDLNASSHLVLKKDSEEEKVADSSLTMVTTKIDEPASEEDNNILHDAVLKSLCSACRYKEKR